MGTDKGKLIVNKTQADIIATIKLLRKHRNPTTVPEIAKASGWNAATVREYLRRMVEDGVVEERNAKFVGLKLPGKKKSVTATTYRLVGETIEDLS